MQDQSSSPASAKAGRPWLAGVLLTVCLAAIAGIIIFSALPLRPMSLWVTVPLWALSAVLMLAILRTLLTGLLRKRNTGRFFSTAAEIAAKRAEYLAKVGGDKPFAPQARFWILPFAFLGALGYFGVLVASAAFLECACSVRLMAMLLALSATLLMLPGILIFKAVQRRIRTGHLLPSGEEIAILSAQCARPASGWQRFGAAGTWTLVAMMWTYTARHGHHHPQQWFTAGLSWLTALLWILRAVRPGRLFCGMPAKSTHQPPA